MVRKTFKERYEAFNEKLEMGVAALILLVSFGGMTFLFAELIYGLLTGKINMQ